MRQSLILAAGPIWAFVFAGVSVFEHRAVVPVSILFAVVCLTQGSLTKTFRDNRPFRFLVYGIALLMLWSAVTLIWAPQVERAAVTFAKFAGNCVVGIIICATVLQADSALRSRLCIGVIVGTIFLATYLLINVATDGALDFALFDLYYRANYGFFWLKTAAALMTLTAWFAAIYVWRRWSKAAAVGIVGGAAVLANAVGFSAAVPALAIGLAVAALVLTLRRWSMYIVLTPLLIVIAVAPLPLQSIDATMLLTPSQTEGGIFRSAIHRLLIWEYASERISERPMTGWGLGASKYFGETEEMHDTRHQYFEEVIPLHPHNGALQIWLELGGIGIILLGGVLVLTARILNLRTIPDDSRAAAWGLFATVITYFLISYGVWSSWWQQYIWFAAALTIAAVPATSPDDIAATRPIR